MKKERREQLGAVIRQLRGEERFAYERAYVPRSDDTFAALAYFFGFLGAARLYLGQPRIAAAQALPQLVVVAAVLDVVPPGAGVLAFLCCVAIGLHDLVFHARIVDGVNWYRKQQALQAIGKLGTTSLEANPGDRRHEQSA